MRRILIIFAVVAAGYTAVQIGNRGKYRKQILTAVTICYGIGFIYFTFFSTGRGHSRVNMIPFYAIKNSLRYPVRMENIRTALMTGQWELVFVKLRLIRNAVLNIFLFIPFGFLLPEWKNRFRPSRILLAGLLVSGMVEIIQLATGCGWFDIDDLICNCIGNVLGILLFKAGSRAGRRNRI